MIPALEDGVLPEGVHDCTFEELDRVFGRVQRTDRRVTLTAKLKAYLDDARRSGLVVTVIVDGSYVTAVDEPDDIDLLIDLKPGIAWDSLRPFEYNAVSKRMIRQVFRFDAFAYPEGTDQYREWLEFFMRVNPDKYPGLTSRDRKGVLRIRL